MSYNIILKSMPDQGQIQVPIITGFYYCYIRYED